MKKLFYIVAMMALGVTLFSSCLGKTTEDEYKDWRNSNLEWYELQSISGQYTTVTAPWDPSAQVLMRWHNDTMLTKDNLKPLLTSTVDVKYHGRLYDDTPFDSSYLRTSPADSIYRSQPSDNIEGWMIALTRMHVGDSCTVIIPYAQGYGSSKKSEVLVPYSMLIFDMKLTNIYKYRDKQ